MQYLAIPMEVLNSEAYRNLSMPLRSFLIDLYLIFQDCERFTIDVDRPQDYKQMAGASMARKINALLAAGFLNVCARQKTTPHHSRRVFKFSHPAIEFIDPDDEIVDAELNEALVELNQNYSVRAC